MEIAFSPQPVAQTPQPRQAAGSSCGRLSSPDVIASNGQRREHLPQSVHASSSIAAT
jgi:hypothetical protein